MTQDMRIRKSDLSHFEDSLGPPKPVVNSATENPLANPERNDSAEPIRPRGMNPKIEEDSEHLKITIPHPGWIFAILPAIFLIGILIVDALVFYLLITDYSPEKLQGVAFLTVIGSMVLGCILRLLYGVETITMNRFAIHYEWRVFRTLRVRILPLSELDRFRENFDLDAEYNRPECYRIESVGSGRPLKIWVHDDYERAWLIWKLNESLRRFRSPSLPKLIS